MKHTLEDQKNVTKLLIDQISFEAKVESVKRRKGWKARYDKKNKIVSTLNSVYTTLCAVSLLKHLPEDQQENSGVKINN
jgi:hypothetical protein